MTFEEAQQAALAWMRRDPVRGRWIRLESEPAPRILVRETKTGEWMEFWPCPHKSIGLIEAPEAAGARAQERAAVCSFLLSVEQHCVGATAAVLQTVRLGIERGEHLN